MGDDFFVLRQGEASVTVHTVKGDKVVGRLGPGDYFGEKALLASAPWRPTLQNRKWINIIPTWIKMDQHGMKMAFGIR